MSPRFYKLVDPLDLRKLTPTRIECYLWNEFFDEDNGALYSALSEIASFVGAISRSRRVFPVGAVGNRTYGPDA